MEQECGKNNSIVIAAALLIFIAWFLCCLVTGQCNCLHILAKGCTNIINEITTHEQHAHMRRFF